MSETTVGWACPHCVTHNIDNYNATVCPMCEECGGTFKWEEILTSVQLEELDSEVKRLPIIPDRLWRVPITINAYIEVLEDDRRKVVLEAQDLIKWAAYEEIIVSGVSLYFNDIKINEHEIEPMSNEDWPEDEENS